MKVRKFIAAVASVAAVGCLAGAARAAVVNVTADTTKYGGFMNVFALPADGGGYQFGSGWGVADLRADFTSTVLTLRANNINDPDTYWYQGGGALGHPGNKIMDANLLIGDDSLVNQSVTFTGNVLSNTLVSGYTATIFVKAFDGSYNTIGSALAPATAGAFNLTLDTTGATHVQYGFTVNGADAWSTDADAKGTVQIALAAVPEPATLAAVGSLAAVGLIRRRRA